MFIPAADFSNASRSTPAQMPAMPLAMRLPTINPDNKGTATLKHSNPDSAAAKVVKRQLPRARKARARLRLQNKLRVAVARNN
jgi:hypothetical protein